MSDPLRDAIEAAVAAIRQESPTQAVGATIVIDRDGWILHWTETPLDDLEDDDLPY